MSSSKKNSNKKKISFSDSDDKENKKSNVNSKVGLVGSTSKKIDILKSIVGKEYESFVYNCHKTSCDSAHTDEFVENYITWLCKKSKKKGESSSLDIQSSILSFLDLLFEAKKKGTEHKEVAKVLIEKITLVVVRTHLLHQFIKTIGKIDVALPMASAAVKIIDNKDSVVVTDSASAATAVAAVATAMNVNLIQWIVTLHTMANVKITRTNLEYYYNIMTQNRMFKYSTLKAYSVNLGIPSPLSSSVNSLPSDLIPISTSSNSGILEKIMEIEKLKKKIEEEITCVPTINIGMNSEDNFSLPISLIANNRNDDNNDKSLFYPYLVTACPKNIYEACDLFQVVLDRKIKLMVSLNCEEEENTCAFWKNENLSIMPMRNGVYLSTTPKDERILFFDKDLDISITERTFQWEQAPQPPLQVHPFNATDVNEKGPVADAVSLKQTAVITHLYFEGWEDGSEVPSEDALLVLIERIEDIMGKFTTKDDNDNNKEFQINCRNSRNRTFILLLIHVSRVHIRNQLSKFVLDHVCGSSEAINMDKLNVNIPELMYKFRLQRYEALMHSNQLSTVQSMVSKFCTRIKNLQAELQFVFGEKSQYKYNVLNNVLLYLV